MSGNSLPDSVQQGPQSGGNQHLLDVEPTISQIVGGEPLTITPLTTQRLGGTLPWETSSKQLQCGDTVTSNDGGQDQQLNMEMVLSHTQFKRLALMRQRDGTVELTSPGYSGPVTFDQLKWDRIEDAHGALTPDRGAVDEPLYMLQLQSREGNNGGSSANDADDDDLAVGPLEAID